MYNSQIFTTETKKIEKKKRKHTNTQFKLTVGKENVEFVEDLLEENRTSLVLLKRLVDLLESMMLDGLMEMMNKRKDRLFLLMMDHWKDKYWK